MGNIVETTAGTYFKCKNAIKEKISNSSSPEVKCCHLLALANIEWKHGNNILSEKAYLDALDVDSANVEVCCKYLTYLTMTARDDDAIRFIAKLPNAVKRYKDISVQIDEINDRTNGCRNTFDKVNWKNISKKSKHDISAIVPNYNYGRYLAKRLISIVEQTWLPAEIIILDDGSHDYSREIMQEFSLRSPVPVRILCNYDNSGSIFKQWQTGINLAHGALVWMAEADDYCENYFLQTLCPFFLDEKVVFAFMDSQPVNEYWQKCALPYKKIFCSNGNDPDFRSDFKLTGRELLTKALLKYCCVPNASAAIFRRSAVPKNWDEIVKFSQAGDWYFWCMLALAGNVAYSARVHNFHRIRTGGSYGRSRPMSLLKEHFRLHEYMRVKAPELYKDQQLFDGIIEHIEKQYQAYLYSGARDSHMCANSRIFGGLLCKLVECCSKQFKTNTLNSDVNQKAFNEKLQPIYKEDKNMLNIFEIAFDAEYYALTYPEYRNRYSHPLLHYVNEGWKNGNNPSPYFNTIYYLSKYPEAISKNVSPVEHFLLNSHNEIFPKLSENFKTSETINKHLADKAFYEAYKAGLFNTNYYTQKYNDIQNDIFAYQHYHNYGWREGRNPSACFDSPRYAEEYLDGDKSINPLLHFINTIPQCDVCCYANKIIEFKTNAKKDRLYDESFYKACNPDIELETEDLFFHYLLFGWKEGRNPSPYFNTDLYIKKYNTDKICPVIDFYAHKDKNFSFIEELHHGYKEIIQRSDIIPDDIQCHLGEIAAFQLKQKGLFDEKWYISKYGDIELSGMKAFNHYSKYGIFENRLPHPEMRFDYYQSEFMGHCLNKNPVIHYIFIGQYQNINIILSRHEKMLLDENNILNKQVINFQNNMEKYRSQLVANSHNDASGKIDNKKNNMTLEEINKMTKDYQAAKQKYKNQLEFFVDQLEVVFKRK